MRSLSRSSSTLFRVVVPVSGGIAPVFVVVVVGGGIAPDDVDVDVDGPAGNMCSRGRPTSMTSPTFPPSDITTPSYLLVISTDALSLCTSQTRSNCDIASPGDTNHCSSSTSAMPSPMSARRKGTVEEEEEEEAGRGEAADPRAVALLDIALVVGGKSNNPRPPRPDAAAATVVVVVVVRRPRRTPREEDDDDDDGGGGDVNAEDEDVDDDRRRRSSRPSSGEGGGGGGCGRRGDDDGDDDGGDDDDGDAATADATRDRMMTDGDDIMTRTLLLIAAEAVVRANAADILIDDLRTKTLERERCFSLKCQIMVWCTRKSVEERVGGVLAEQKNDTPAAWAKNFRRGLACQRMTTSIAPTKHRNSIYLNIV